MPNIFIVDDNRLFSEILRAVICFSYPSAIIKEFQNGKNIIMEIETNPPDLIFMEIDLPGMDGLTLTKMVKEKNNRISVIVYTSYNFSKFTTTAAEVGADRLICKNVITKNEILNLIDSALNGSFS